jgi:hypothetical protein
MNQANYTVEHIDAKRIVIRDLGPWDMYQTVTNAAESVVDELSTSDRLVGRRLFYYDSEGDLGELLIKDGKFAGFAPADSVW